MTNGAFTFPDTKTKADKKINWLQNPVASVLVSVYA